MTKAMANFKPRLAARLSGAVSPGKEVRGHSPLTPHSVPVISPCSLLLQQDDFRNGSPRLDPAPPSCRSYRPSWHDAIQRDAERYNDFLRQLEILVPLRPKRCGPGSDPAGTGPISWVFRKITRIGYANGLSSFYLLMQD